VNDVDCVVVGSDKVDCVYRKSCSHIILRPKMKTSDKTGYKTAFKKELDKFADKLEKIRFH
jgi:hypothetical protein